MSIHQTAIDAVTTRATTDRDFRSRLIADPNAAIGEVLGRPLPATAKIQVIEASPAFDATLVIPEFIDAESELNAEELEAVAGGVAAEQELSWCDHVCITISTNVSV